MKTNCKDGRELGKYRGSNFEREKRSFQLMRYAAILYNFLYAIQIKVSPSSNKKPRQRLSPGGADRSYEQSLNSDLIKLCQFYFRFKFIQ